MSLTLTSPVIGHNEDIPARFTCDGDDVSPPLSWSGVPADAKSLVLIVDDPDAPDPKAPRMTWVHWVLYNIPPGKQLYMKFLTAFLVFVVFGLLSR